MLFRPLTPTEEEELERTAKGKGKSGPGSRAIFEGFMQSELYECIVDHQELGITLNLLHSRLYNFQRMAVDEFPVEVFRHRNKIILRRTDKTRP